MRSSNLLSTNQELKNMVEQFSFERASFMRQLDKISNAHQKADAGSKEKSNQLFDQAKKLKLMEFERDKFKEIAGNAQKLEEALAAYRRLGTIVQLQGLKDEIQKIKEMAGNLGQKDRSTGRSSNLKAPVGAEIGVILSVDTTFDLCVISIGSVKGVAKGNEYHIHRAGNFIGKIKIDEVRPAVSIGFPIRKFTPKALRAGDKVIQGG